MNQQIKEIRRKMYEILESLDRLEAEAEANQTPEPKPQPGRHIPGYFSADEIVDLLLQETGDQITTTRAHALAGQHGIESPFPGLYEARGVLDYIQARVRARIMGRTHPYKKGDLDLANGCPICGQFAIRWPDTTQYTCVQGHTGELE